MNSAMKKKADYIFGLGVVFMMFFVNEAFSGMECEGTQYGGVYYKKGQHYYPIKSGVTYDCVDCGRSWIIQCFNPRPRMGGD